MMPTFADENKVHPYDVLALIYDQFQSDWDVASWADFYEQAAMDALVTTKVENEDILALDIGCGTGLLSIELCTRGWKVCGIDISEGMLQRARISSRELPLDLQNRITFTQADICNWSSDDKFAVAFSSLDTFNHLTQEQLRIAFRNVHDSLQVGGVFLFDLLTLAYMEEQMGEEFYYDIAERHAVLWENHFQHDRLCNESEITIFYERHDAYQREDICIREYFHTIENVSEILEKIGFEVSVLEDKPRSTTDESADGRYFLLAKKQ